MRAIHTRKAALEILVATELRGAFSSDLLAKAARSKAINFPLLQRLVKGTIEWRDRLDAELAPRIGVPLASLSPEARGIARLAAYQLLFLERVPFDRVRAESLALLSKEKPAVKDRITKLLDDLRAHGRLPQSRQPTGGSAEEIARHFSHPAWLVARWIADFGTEETKRLCAANNRAWPVAIRANTLKISAHQLGKRLAREGVSTTPSRYAPDCLIIKRLPRHRRLDELEAFHLGLFQVQDESAALVGCLVRPRPNSTVVDLCAAPGGKATHLAMLMRNRGSIIALDINPQRLKSVSANCRRLGLSTVKPKTGDAAAFRLAGGAERVLLDAPCSGFGVLGRKTDIRWSKSPAAIDELTALQRKLLNHAATLVAPGGLLVYSTCTVERAENETIVEDFLKTHPEFSVEPPPEDLARELFTPAGFLRTWPHRHGIGGAFAAALRRQKSPSQAAAGKPSAKRSPS